MTEEKTTVTTPYDIYIKEIELCLEELKNARDGFIQHVDCLIMKNPDYLHAAAYIYITPLVNILIQQLSKHLEENK